MSLYLCPHCRTYTTSSESVDWGLGVMRCVHQLEHVLHPGGGCACLGLGDRWETFIPSPQCCHESKAAAMKSLFKKCTSLSFPMIFNDSINHRLEKREGVDTSAPLSLRVLLPEIW